MLITKGKEFAVLERRSNTEGLQGITLSVELSAKDADVIDKSGIAEVELLKKDGTISFRRKDFYTNYLMIELIIDILKRHEKRP